MKNFDLKVGTKVIIKSVEQLEKELELNGFDEIVFETVDTSIEIMSKLQNKELCIDNIDKDGDLKFGGCCAIVGAEAILKVVENNASSRA